MLVQRARSVYWKKWAAKHEYELLLEGASLEPGLALLREKVRENWTEKHRNAARKLFLEGGWAQKRLFDVGWSGTSQCQACQTEKHTEKHRVYHCPEWQGIRRRCQRLSESGSKKRGLQRRSGSGKEVLSRILSMKANGTDAHSSMKKCEAEKHKSWCMPVGGFMGHATTDGSLL